jgi:hypothetical protein
VIVAACSRRCRTNPVRVFPEPGTGLPTRDVPGLTASLEELTPRGSPSGACTAQRDADAKECFARRTNPAGVLVRSRHCPTRRGREGVLRSKNEPRSGSSQAVARSQNALRVRWENLWSSELTCGEAGRPRGSDGQAGVHGDQPGADQLVQRAHHQGSRTTLQRLLGVNRPLAAYHNRQVIGRQHMRNVGDGNSVR